MSSVAPDVPYALNREESWRRMLRLDPAQRFRWRDDRDALEGVEIEQVIIARGDELDLSGEREDLIVIRIAADRCRQRAWGGRPTSSSIEMVSASAIAGNNDIGTRRRPTSRSTVPLTQSTCRF